MELIISPPGPVSPYNRKISEFADDNYRSSVKQQRIVVYAGALTYREITRGTMPHQHILDNPARNLNLTKTLFPLFDARTKDDRSRLSKASKATAPKQIGPRCLTLPKRSTDGDQELKLGRTARILSVLIRSSIVRYYVRADIATFPPDLPLQEALTR